MSKENKLQEKDQILKQSHQMKPQLLNSSGEIRYAAELNKTKGKGKCRTQKQISPSANLQQIESKAQQLAQLQNHSRKALLKLKKMYDLKVEQVKYLQKLQIEERIVFQSVLNQKCSQIESKIKQIYHLNQKIAQLTQCTQMKQSFIYASDSVVSPLFPMKASYSGLSSFSKEQQLTCADLGDAKNSQVFHEASPTLQQLQDCIAQIINSHTIPQHRPIYQFLTEYNHTIFQVVKQDNRQDLAQSVINQVETQLGNLNLYFMETASKNINKIQELLQYMDKSNQNVMKSITQPGEKAHKRKSILDSILIIPKQRIS